MNLSNLKCSVYLRVEIIDESWMQQGSMVLLFSILNLQD